MAELVEKAMQTLSSLVLSQESLEVSQVAVVKEEWMWIRARTNLKCVCVMTSALEACRKNRAAYIGALYLDRQRQLWVKLQVHEPAVQVSTSWCADALNPPSEHKMRLLFPSASESHAMS